MWPSALREKVLITWIVSVKFSSVTQSCLTLCDPMDCSMPGFPIHHQLPELAQTHIHCIGDAIQPSHSLLSPPPPALNLSQHQSFPSELALCIRWPKYWSFSFSISPSNGQSKWTIMLALIRPIYSDFWEYFTILETLWPWFLSFFFSRESICSQSWKWKVLSMSSLPSKPPGLVFIHNVGQVEICSDSKVTPCIPPPEIHPLQRPCVARRENYFSLLLLSLLHTLSKTNPVAQTVKNPPADAGDISDMGSIPGWVCWATVHEVTKSQTWLIK